MRAVSDVFERIVCGVDGSEASLHGLRQAARLAGDSSKLLLVTVVNEASIAAATAGAAGLVVPPPISDVGKESLEQGLEVLRAEAPGVDVETRVLEGPVLPTFL